MTPQERKQVADLAWGIFALIVVLAAYAFVGTIECRGL